MESKTKRKFDVHKLTYSLIISLVMLTISVALALADKYIPDLRLQNEGNVSFAIAPLILNALLVNPFFSILTGLAYGGLNIVIDQAFSTHWLSLLLDYALVYGCIGFCGMFRKSYLNNKSRSIILATLTYFIISFICHFFTKGLITIDAFGSPYIDTSSLTRDKIFSTICYNLGYLIPSFLIVCIVLLYLVQPLFMFNSSKIMRTIRGKLPYDEKEMKDNLKKAMDIASLNILFIVTIFAVLFFIPRFLQNFTKALGLTVFSFMILSVVGVDCFSLYWFMEDKISNEAFNPSNKIQKKMFHESYKYDLFLIIYSVVPLVLSIVVFIKFALYLK